MQEIKEQVIEYIEDYKVNWAYQSNEDLLDFIIRTLNDAGLIGALETIQDTFVCNEYFECDEPQDRPAEWDEMHYAVYSNYNNNDWELVDTETLKQQAIEIINQ